MTTFLATMTEFLTWSLTSVGSVMTTIIDTPALTVMCIAMPIIGFAVGLLTRLFRA